MSLLVIQARWCVHKTNSEINLFCVYTVLYYVDIVDIYFVSFQIKCFMDFVSQFLFEYKYLLRTVLVTTFIICNVYFI